MKRLRTEDWFVYSFEYSASGAARVSRVTATSGQASVVGVRISGATPCAWDPNRAPEACAASEIASGLLEIVLGCLPPGSVSRLRGAIAALDCARRPPARVDAAAVQRIEHPFRHICP